MQLTIGEKGNIVQLYTEVEFIPTQPPVARAQTFGEEKCL
jgi:hypothetical protein